MASITITDMVGASGSVTVDKDGAAEAIRDWYPESAPSVHLALDLLQALLDRNEYTGDMETYLGIKIS